MKVLITDDDGVLLDSCWVHVQQTGKDLKHSHVVACDKIRDLLEWKYSVSDDEEEYRKLIEESAS